MTTKIALVVVLLTGICQAADNAAQLIADLRNRSKSFQTTRSGSLASFNAGTGKFFAVGSVPSTPTASFVPPHQPTRSVSGHADLNATTLGRSEPFEYDFDPLNRINSLPLQEAQDYLIEQFTRKTHSIERLTLEAIALRKRQDQLPKPRKKSVYYQGAGAGS